MDGAVGVNGHGVTTGSTLNGGIINGDSTNSLSTNCHLPTDSTSANNELHGDCDNGQIPIAICGMSCRLPGGLMTPHELWEFLVARKDARCRVPETRYNISSYYSPTPKSGMVSTEYGYYLDKSVDLRALDTSFFTLLRNEVERADPQQRLMLEVTRECLEDAGEINYRGKTIGCYIGNFGQDWLEMLSKESQPWGTYHLSGTGDWTISNRLSYEFDLKGPSMTIRTACSSTLVALNEACAAMGRGDCEAAVVGGVNLILSPSFSVAMTEQGILSPDGSCKSFSADANGYARAEGVTAVYIKPLATAIRDGSPVRAVIRATSHNSDGKTSGLSYPSTDAQEALIRRAYQLAGITDYSQTAMVECHGTGTPIGDPIEAKAVARVFGDKGVYIGSVKPNMGHTEAGSGLVSLLKMVMALEHRIIPPNIKFTSPNPNIPFEAAKLTVPVESTTWPEDRLERVSLNSFGIGGSNAHLILESVASYNVSSATTQEGAPEEPQLLLFTANSAKSLTRMIDNYKGWVERNQGKIRDLAYTLARRREHLPHRAFAVIKDGVMENASPPANLKSVKKPDVIMVFTGQGAQWPQMGRELLQSNVVFQSRIRSLDHHLQTIAGEKPSYSIEEELKKPPTKSRLSSAELSQPLCTAIQIALVDTLKSLAIMPSAVVGHSSGEIAAAYACGALTAEEAITVSHHRGAVTSRQKRAGTMAAIGMSWAETEKYLIPNVTISCDNSPRSVTISGDIGAVEAVVADMKAAHPDVLARRLRVDKAYHSYHMTEIGDAYRTLIDQEVIGREPSAALFFSSVTGNLLGGDRTISSQYWQDNLESPVRFREAIMAILNHEVGKSAVFLEVGPHSALAGPLRQIFTHSPNPAPAPYVSVMTRNRNATQCLLTAVGNLHLLNVPIDLEALFPTGSCLPDLPRYPWDHDSSYWHESRISSEWRRRKQPYHDLLGVKVAESTDLEPIWRNLLHLTNIPWIRDHRLGENIVFPFAGYMAMAGEAVRQLTNVDDGFSIRNIIVSTALTLGDNGKPTEIITTCRPHRLTNSLNSPSWWEFTVASYNGRSWTKHCTGQVSALSSKPKSGQDPDLLPRKVDAGKWYDTMRKSGFDLGPCFQTLDTMETSTGSENRAIGKVINGRRGDEAHYHIHPTVLDATLQIITAAAINGCARKYRNWVPTSIEKFSVYRCEADMITCVTARLSSNFSIVAEGRCTSGGQTVVEASGIRGSLAEGAGSIDPVLDTHASARYEWSPDINFMGIKELLSAPADHTTDTLRLLEELGQMCLLLSKRQFCTWEPNLPHLQKYIAWLVSQSSSFSTLDNETISSRIKDLMACLLETPAAPVAHAIHEVYTRMDLVLLGQPLEHFLPDGALTALYAFVERLDRSRFIQSLGHSKPNLRILEIGTGRCSLYREILKELTRPNGEILCSQYTYTSPGFISAKVEAQVFPNMEYLNLDISQDPFEQGLEDRRYDLIIAVNALHGTKSLQKSLENVKKLLCPDGQLLLQELCPSSKWINYVLGVLPTWWTDTTDGRNYDEPYIGKEEWESQLAAAGFGGVGVILDAEEPHQLTATILARHVSLIKAPMKKIIALYEEEGPVVQQVSDQLEREGYQVTQCKLDETPPEGQDVISLLDAEKPFFDGIEEARFLSFQTFIHSLRGVGILWVTHLTDIGCCDPRYAQVIGFARVIRSETLADFATCQVDSFHNPKSIDHVIRVLARFQAREGDATLHPDFEWAITDGRVQVGRFYPFVLTDELLVSDSPNDKATLNVRTVGRVNSLHWMQKPREDLTTDQVEVQVHSAGLNFRDILVALGIVELSIRVFGLEAAGIVTRVGSGVDPNELRVGDRVFCFCKNEALSTYVTTLAAFCIRIPDRLDFDHAGSMVIPYVTAIHSLVNIGRLSKGQSVLVHSACGGVGLAALQVAHMLEAEVYATVGSDEKVEYLMHNYHIPRTRIFNSRDQSFVDGIIRETGGRGVDLILNSLSGELLHATWSCVAEFGTLVEIGKRDLLGDGKLDMRPFLANRNYCCVDIDGVSNRIHTLRSLLLSILEYYTNEHISPLPTKIFPAAQIQDAFRYMEMGQHIGRIGISIQHPTGEEAADLAFETTKRTRPITFNGSASYLMIGGLGGLGQAISTWMVEHGARELVYLSRSAGVGTKDDTFVNEIQSMECDVTLVRGDVAKLDDVKRAITAATHPLKGVLQMSMVLRNENFTKMTFDEWAEGTRSKVQGTWNLHHATVAAGADLDFFVLFSSLSGVVGQPGQANYASANTFLDAFAQYRNGLGLAASVVDIGAVEGIGIISRYGGMIGKISRSGFRPISEQQVLDSMAVAMIVRNRPAEKEALLAVGCSRFVHTNSFALGLALRIPLNDPSNYVVWKKDRRMAAYHNHGGSGASTVDSTDTLKSYLTRTKTDPSLLQSAEAAKIFAGEIGKKLFDLLLKPQEELNTTLPLVNLGLDSLVAIELRSWFKQVFSFAIPMLEMLGMGSLDLLGQRVANELFSVTTENSNSKGC